MSENIPYKFGHYCKPNGVGDFDFVCPIRGEKPGFVPYLLAFRLSGECACGQKIERIIEMEDQIPDEPKDLCLFKLYECWGDETPIMRYQLSANGPEEYRALLKQLELLADILPYISEAEKKAKKTQKHFQYSTTLENLKAAIALGIVEKSEAIDLGLQLGGNIGE